MGMLLTSNSTSNALAAPDGFNPPFSLEGCEYFGLFDKDPGVNFAPGKQQPTIIGDMIRDGLGIKMKASVNYIDTGVVPGTGDLTLIAVVDKSSAVPTVGDASARIWLVSSYSGTAGADVGASLAFEGKDAGGKPQNISHYRSISADGTPTRDTLQAVGSVSRTSDFGIYVGRSYKDGTDTRGSILNLRNEGSAGNTITGKIPATTSSSLRIGSAVSTVPNPNASSVTVYCAMVFKRNIGTEELRVIRTWLYDYYRRRGVTGV